MSDAEPTHTADDVLVREIADAVAERVRLKKGGEVVRYVRTVLDVLNERGLLSAIGLSVERSQQHNDGGGGDA